MLAERGSRQQQADRGGVWLDQKLQIRRPMPHARNSSPIFRSLLDPGAGQPEPLPPGDSRKPDPSCYRRAIRHYRCLTRCNAFLTCSAYRSSAPRPWVLRPSECPSSRKRSATSAAAPLQNRRRPSPLVRVDPAAHDPSAPRAPLRRSRIAGAGRPPAPPHAAATSASCSWRMCPCLAETRSRGRSADPAPAAPRGWCSPTAECRRGQRQPV